MGADIGPYSTAGAMLAALASKDVGSVELVQLHLDRIEAHDGALNAVPVRTPELALEAAARADEARARGEVAPLLGLPMTLKESTQVAGLPQSAGIEAFAAYRPAADGPLARRVFAAGACLLGKTNIPVALADWQADSPVYGRTNNPWDPSRSPGGSTGGGGAALAAGMTPLEVGSDIGGSIRVPAAFCGVYGHRPSETAVPRAGSFPLADLENPASVMGVQGPLARSAFDLELLFDVLAGPVDGEEAGWRLHLPPARHERLADFRVAVMPPLNLATPSADVQHAVEELVGVLRSAGATVGLSMPAVDPESYFADYLTMLALITSQGQSREQREAGAAQAIASGDAMLAAEAAGLTIDAHGFLDLHRRRERARLAWREFFRDWDVLVCPTALGSAFPHQTAPFPERTLDLDGRSVPYGLNLVYPMWAIFPGQPATAFPAGLDPRGLPLGLQAVGPYLEDRTTLRFAQLLEREWRDFEPPPGYAP